MTVHVVTVRVVTMGLAQKVAVAVLALFLCTVSASAQSASGKATPIDRGFATTSEVVMRIYVPKGRLRVSTWTRDSVHVRGTVGASASFFGGGSRTHVKLGVETRATNEAQLPEADWVVQVPQRARLWIKQIDGDLEVTGLQAELEAYTVGGRMVVRNVSGNTILESIDAPVTVESARGDLRVRGSKGAVVIRDVDATVSVATVSGPVTVTGGRPDGRVETIGGDVTIERPQLTKAELEIQTHSGGITVRVDPRKAPLMDLSTRAGAPSGDRITGQALFGRLVARSFKGPIVVQRLP